MKKHFYYLYKIALKIFLLFLIFNVISGCGRSDNEQFGSPKYVSSIEKWHKQRIENLKKDNGWLNLVGLYWLKEGINKIGSADDNDIVFPKAKAPGYIGTVMVKDSIVTFQANPNAGVTYNGKPVGNIELQSDMTDNPTVLAEGSLRWFLIKREDKLGIRLRDLNVPLVKNLTDIKTFPVNEKWKITAKFVPYKPYKIITIPSIIGTVEHDTVRGSLVFNLKGIEYRLDPIAEGNEFFIIFADQTSGEETYGAGRFLYTDKPDSSGNVVLDFNKAYNPPCAFTPFATCPLPPKQNYLQLKITAGEKNYGKGNHA